MSIIEEAAKRLQQLRQQELNSDAPASNPAPRQSAQASSRSNIVEAALARAAATPPRPTAPAPEAPGPAPMALKPASPAPRDIPDVDLGTAILPDPPPRAAPESREGRIAPEALPSTPGAPPLSPPPESSASAAKPVAQVSASPPPEAASGEDNDDDEVDGAPNLRIDRSRYAELNIAQLNAKGILTPDAPRSQLADEFRMIKRPLLLNAQGKGPVPVANGNLIMVTSSVPGEGKTFSAINLAMSIAMEIDIAVLLVDSDVSRPSVLNTLGLPAARGLMDVLLDDNLDLSDVMLRTNIRKFNILPVGSAAKRATELLASEAMNRLLSDLATRYADRIIIFDSPPLLVTTEAPVLARHMGQIVMVVNSGSTSRSLVKQSLATISTCPVIMMLLNKVSSPGKGGYYDYYGYGGYGAYGANVPG